MTPSADMFQLTLSLAADTTIDLPEIRELTMRFYDKMQGSTTEIFATTDSAPMLEVGKPNGAQQPHSQA